MNYELDYFEQILLLIKKQIEIKPEEIDIECEMSGEISRIKQRIDTHVPLHDIPFKSYIDYHLNCFERFKLRIDQMEISSADQKDKETLEKLDVAMDDLIEHIYHYYPNEFNPDTIATGQYLQIYQKQYGILETDTIKSLEAHQINTQLTLIIETILNGHPTRRPTFLETDFKRTLMDHLQPILTSSGPDTQITMLLIAMKYNDPNFYTYQLNSLHRKQQKAISAAEQFRELILYKKELDQLMEIREVNFFPQNPNIKTMLLQAIDAEIIFLKVEISLKLTTSFRFKLTTCSAEN